MTFGRQVEENLSIEIMHTALDAGVNFIDTADMYVNGVTEEIVGKAMKGKRDQIVLASKGGHVRKLGNKWGEQRDSGPIDLARPKPFHPWPGQTDAGPNDMGLSRKHLMQAVEGSLKRLGTDYLDIYYAHMLEGSLKRLGTDYLDIYYAHMPDYDTPLEETLRAMDDLVHQGKVRYLACSNFRAFQLCKALWLSDKYNLARWDCIQPPYNLLTRDIEYEQADPIKGARFSLAHQGYRYNLPYWNESNFAAVEEIAKIAEAHGQRLPQFALAWVLSNPTITSVVCGATSIEQLQENMVAADIKLSQEALDACNQVWHQLRPPRLFYGR
jgi:aryl-alcohol dehydrogenase-like predicted oxidoreductase